MRRPRLLLLVAPIALATLLALFWVRAASGSLLPGLLGARIPWVVAALTLTAAWLFVRFLRWQFLLRRVGVRLPIRPTLHTYVAGLPGTATPAYIGEAIRGVLLRRRFGVPLRVSLAVLVLERLYDVLALGVLALILALFGGRPATIGASFAVLAVAAGMLLWPAGRHVGIAPDAMRRLRGRGTVGVATGLSLVTWAVASLILPVAGAALHVDLSVVQGAAVFAESTLLGALTLLPAGFGATGSVAIVRLSDLGILLERAVIVVSLLRLTSTGAALLVGSVFLWRELRGDRRVAVAEGAAHFDEIAEQYNAQWSPHVWDLLLERKIGFITQALPGAPGEAGLGLDLGCGLGLQTAELRRRGYRVVGLDPSVGLLQVGQQRSGPSPVLAGSALALPFAEGTFEFVYCIGVLHHLPGRVAQDAAIREIARVLKPGGRLLVHESNPRNPLFRFYMGYLFPILKSIDEGTEWWIDPRFWASRDELRVENVRYFTFLPDFTPQVLMRPALRLEGLLERGPTRQFSAHYLAVLQRPPEGVARYAQELGEPVEQSGQRVV